MQIKMPRISPALELFIISAISLFVELLIIRWMSSDIRAFTVFRTFPLISCFVGLGLGMALGNDKSYRLFPVVTLAFCLMMKALDVLGMNTFAFPTLSVFQWENLAGLVGTQFAYIVLIVLLSVLMLALPFGMCVTIGARLGTLFNQLSPLSAYSYNILGAITGSILFQALNFLGLAPPIILLLPIFVVTGLQLSTRKMTVVDAAPFALIPMLFVFMPSQQALPLIPELLSSEREIRTHWSPYQRIDVSVLQSKSGKNDGTKLEGLELSTNHTFYQYLFNTDQDSHLAKKTQLIDLVRQDYALPFTFNKSESVLIVGAGTGQNVSFALSGGAKTVDAVEIDPVILQIGKQYNPDYSSPSVTLVCDDARHFFSTCKKRYDVIDFSTLDSHTVTGFGSSVRLDSYIYTKESIARALSLLNKDGVLLVSFATVAPWSQERLYRTFSEASGYDPLLLEGQFSSSIFILGEPVKNHTLVVPSNYKVVKGDFKTSRILTDDWPYLYVQPDVVDYPYLLVVATILLISIYATRRHIFQKNHPSTWQMSFLGMAFMLLELHAISFLSLLYGSTWMTSSLVINGILIMILIANWFVIKLGARVIKHQPLAYCALLVAILVSYSLPVQQLLNSLDTTASYFILTFFTLLPLGAAAVVFSSAFSEVPDASRALAFNLFGAVIGGLLEYISNYTGIRNLLLAGVVIYALSFLCYLASRRSISNIQAPQPGEISGA